MKIKILFDNEASDKKISIGWGFSCLVNDTILFDTGEKEKYLFNNMDIMKVDFNKIEEIVISHEHWDHTGGLWGIIKKKKRIIVYGCPLFSKVFKEKVKKLDGEFIAVNKPMRLKDNIFITGEIVGIYNKHYIIPEQALFVKTKKGVSIITGCAHPGIIRMIVETRRYFSCNKIYSVFGGFHLKNESKNSIKDIVKQFREMKIQKAGPTHCSGKIAENVFKKRYKDDFISVKSGDIYYL